MKLHRVVLTNYKGVDHREVDFPESGVIILEGPNEVGKTSMVEALDLLLEEKDSSRKRQVEAVRPVGRDVPTAIEAEISSGPYRFTYRKQWFKKPATELRVTAPRVEQLVGVRAHERVLHLLGETVDMALWKAMRMLQATPLVQEDLSGSAALSEALDAAAGKAGAGDGETILASVEAEYTRYFTPRAGSPTGVYRTMQAEVARLTEAARAVEAALEDVQHDVDAFAGAEQELGHCERELAHAAAELSALVARWAQIEELQRTVDAAQTRVRLAESEWERAVHRRDERLRLVRECAELAESHAELAGEVARLREELVMRDLEQEQLHQAQRAAEAAERQARDVWDGASRDLAHLREVEARHALDARLRAVDDAEERRAAAAERVRGVDTATWARIDQADRACENARLVQRAANARLEITALAEGQALQLDGVRLELPAGERLERSLGEALEVVVPGALRLLFEPEAGARERAVAVAAAEETLAVALRDAGVKTVDEARAQHAARRAAEDELKEAAAALQSLLQGERVVDLRKRWQVHEDSIAAYREARSTAVPLPAGVAAAEAGVAEASRAQEQARDGATESRRAADVARVQREGNAQRLADSTRRSELAAVRLTEAQRRCDEHRAATPDAVVEAAVSDASAALVQARNAEADAVRQLRGEDPERVQELLAGARQMVEAWEDRRRRQAEERASIRGRLEKAGSYGLQEEYDAARSRLDHAERELAAIDQRATAVELLRATLLRHRAAAQRAYAAPFADAVNQLGRVVYDPTFEVEVDDQLRIVARVIDGQSIPFEALSTGAKEQLAVLTRLACAGLVDGEQGVPIVIDDALGYSDPGRLQRICAAFSVLEHDSQILLLTCTPGRYAIAGAAHVRLG